MTAPPRKRVVIVGGQFAGRKVEALLSGRPQFTVALVDAKDFFEYTPSVLRALVEPATLGHILVRHPGSVLVAGVVGVDVYAAGGAADEDGEAWREAWMHRATMAGTRGGLSLAT